MDQIVGVDHRADVGAEGDGRLPHPTAGFRVRDTVSRASWPCLTPLESAKLTTRPHVRLGSKEARCQSF